MSARHGSWRSAIIAVAIIATAACGRAPRQNASPRAKNLLLITIDTLRADHVGAYGYARAHTPVLDGLARGVRFERAYAAAPITLPSHATILTGRYPPGHGARDNGLHMSATVPTIATVLHARGFKTGAFVAAFPLDHQFGLDRGFDVYGDHLPRGADGRQVNERPASQVVDEAIAWLGTNDQGPTPNDQRPTTNDQRPTTNDQRPFFLWVHFFEPHAPYSGNTSRPILERYDEEIATVDREIGRLLNALGDRASETVIIATGDHGEAFGEHGEYAHSIFVYDTTLRVPLLMVVPGLEPQRRDAHGRIVSDPVTLADVAPTIAKLLGADMKDVDGIDLSPAFSGAKLPPRELYAESFAPLVEFGWAPLRAIRSKQWKFIAAPKPELFDIDTDPAERTNLATAQEPIVRQLDGRVARYSLASLPVTRVIDASGAERGRGAPAQPDRGVGAPGVINDRLRALGYANGPRHDDDAGRVDPKDRREVAARIAQVTSGELSGAALASALEDILRVDASNSQAHMRLGYVRLEQGDCAHAEQEFTWAINSGLPSADAHLGLATCLGRRNDLAGAARVLEQARQREPSNPIVTANLGILQASRGDNAAAIRSLQAALAADPNLHEARFNLALAYARLGRRTEAIAAAQDLLSRLPLNAPQRTEVQRFLRSLQ